MELNERGIRVVQFITDRVDRNDTRYRHYVVLIERDVPIEEPELT